MRKRGEKTYEMKNSHVSVLKCERLRGARTESQILKGARIGTQILKFLISAGANIKHCPVWSGLEPARERNAPAMEASGSRVRRGSPVPKRRRGVGVATGFGSTAQSLNDDILRSVFSRLDDHFDLARCSAVWGSWSPAPPPGPPPPPPLPFHSVVLLVAKISRSLRYAITFVPCLILAVSLSMIFTIVNLCLLLVNSFGVSVLLQFRLLCRRKND
jgi:hypothetical protein